MSVTAKKPATKRAPARRPKAQPRQPDHHEIALRAYFIHLKEGGADQVGNWLRAERELAAA